MPEPSLDSSAVTQQDKGTIVQESESDNIEEATVTMDERQGKTLDATTNSNIPTNEVPSAADNLQACLQSNFSQKVKVQSAEEHRRINSMGRSIHKALK